MACQAYGVTEHGNFEHGGLQCSTVRSSWMRCTPARLRDWRERLLAARGRRVRPARDDNILTGWNGLMIEGLCAAFQATGCLEYLSAAQRAPISSRAS